MPSKQATVRVLWKIYFWLFVLINVAALGLDFSVFKDIPWSSSDWLAFVATPFGMIGLFGYAYHRGFLAKRFWMIASVLVLCSEFVVPFTHAALTTGLDIDLRETDQAVAVIITLILFLPYAYGLIAYGYGSDSIWQNSRKTNFSP